MADITNLYQVSTGATVLAEDHNSLVNAATALNAEIGLIAGSLSTHVTATAVTDGGWAGSRTQCFAEAASGYLYPGSGSTFGAMTAWADLWNPQWQSYSYVSRIIDLGAVYHSEITLSVIGNYLAGTPAIEIHWSPDGTAWNVWSSTQAGLSVTTVRKAVRCWRFKLTVPQSGNLPCYTAGVTYTVRGPQFGETGQLAVAVGGTALTFAKTYPTPPLVLVTPLYLAEQDVRHRISAVTATGCQVDLVLADSPATPINGAINYQILSQ